MIAFTVGLWMGVGIGMVVTDALECGAPSELIEWADWVLCLFLWPVGLVRRLIGK